MRRSACRASAPPQRTNSSRTWVEFNRFALARQ
jgi:hypothetical protein